jgi:hypothetical protein
MSALVRLGFFAVLAGSSCAILAAQAPNPHFAPRETPAPSSADAAAPAPIDLNWTPPALAALSSQAAVKNSFTLDRNLLAAAAGILPDDDSDVKQTIAKLDGLGVHMLRFGPDGIPDQAAIDAIRAAYHQTGWKHLVASSATNAALHDNTTDIWLLLDGVNVRGAVVMEVTPRSLTLVTIAGKLNPVDLLRLRGRFGIPRFNSDALGAPTQQ